MAVTFLTDKDKNSIDKDINLLRDNFDSISISKIPIEVVMALKGGNSSKVTATKFISNDDKTIGINTIYEVADNSYILCGAQLGTYSEVASKHPRVYVMLYPKHDMDVCVTFSNAPNAWDSVDGYVKAYADTVLHLKANEPSSVVFDYTNSDVQEFYADSTHSKGVAVIVSLAGRITSNPHGEYELDWYITDEFVTNFTAERIGHAEIANYAAIANIANTAVLAENASIAEKAHTAVVAENALQGTKITSWHVFRSALRLQESGFGGLRIKFSPGEITDSVCIFTTQSLGKVADLRDKKFLIKCVRRSLDNSTDIAWRWRLSHSNSYYQEWGQDKGVISHLGGLATYCNNGSYFTIDYDACGYTDTDDVYLRINNGDVYESQAPYSMDVDLLVYVVPADYAERSGMVIATKLDGFEPTEYLRKDETGTASVATAGVADNAKNAISGDATAFHKFSGGATIQPSEKLISGYRIGYAVGENSALVSIFSTKSIGKVAELRDKKFLIKCINRNQDTATDISGKWAFAHSNSYSQEWGQDRGTFTDLSVLSAKGVSILSIDYDACGYADTDDVYLRINNKGSYTEQTPFSLDVEFVVYVVPANYSRDAGIVVATKLDGFDPDEYLRKDEAGVATEKYITCWGDSLTAQGGWTSTLQSLSGLPVYNGGTGGENVRTIAARQGADVMMLNGIAIPADTTPVTLATYAQGIPTEFGYKATPLLQGGAHVNPVMLGDIEGTLRWTGSSYNDTTGVWTFTRSKAGEAVTLKRPTAMRTNFDRVRNAPYLMVIYIGQNGGYTDLDDLARMHRLMIEHSHAKNVVVLGFSSGSAAQRSEYEARMRKEFGRYFISLREYLSHPIYAEDGSTIVSCYGLDDAGLTATDADLAAITTGTVPP